MAPRGASGRLLLGSLAWAAGCGPDLAPLARRVRSWPPLLEQAGRWGVAEALAYAIEASGAADAVPDAVRGRLRAAHEAAAASNLALLAEAARVQAVLARAGVPSVALKGTALVAAHYPLAGARHVGDLDLLVPRARLADAAAALAPESRGVPPALDHEGREVGFPAHLAPLMTAGGVCCELHFDAPGDPGGALAVRMLVTPRQVEVPGGGLLTIPLPAHCAAVACLHALAGHEGSPVFLPRLVSDLEAIDATAGLDWGAIHSAAGLEGTAWIARGRALLDAARAGAVAKVFPGGLETLARDLVVPFLRRAVASPRAAVRTLLPSRAFMAARYGLEESSRRVLLYYVARPFLAARDRLRR